MFRKIKAFRSYLFHDLPAALREPCASLGYDYDALCDAKDRLFATLHSLDEDSIALNAGAETAFVGARFIVY
eukprot:COSAG06_NODE_4515_length_4189_cov_12.834230_8_plen_72_part_00